jgi:glycosyltransferase involved in cell wall biosynthesis
MYLANVDWFFLSHRQELAAAAAAAGAEVLVAVTDTGSARDIEALGVRVRTVRLPRGTASPSAEVRGVRDVRAAWREFRPDLVHAIGPKPILLAGALAQFDRSVALVATVSGLGAAYLSGGDEHGAAGVKRAVLDRAYRLALGRRQCVAYFQNYETARRFIDLGCVDPSNSRFFPGSGVDLERFDAAAPYRPSGPPIVLFASRLLRSKGVLDLLAAAAALEAQGVVARYVICGRSEPHNPDAIDPAVFRAHPGVEFRGLVDNVPALMADAAVVVLPSYYPEGTPKVLLEAAAAGRPAITTDTPGCRDAVVDGLTGLVVPPRDPASLASAIATVLRAPEVGAEMGRRARWLAEERFGVDRLVTRTLDDYGALMSDRTRKGETRRS